jgi:branched-chain amino acid transport system substrate-binding protein
VFAGVALAQDTVKIGVTQPLTGAVAADGNYVAQGAKLAAEAINKAGGVDGQADPARRRGQQVEPDRGSRHRRTSDRPGQGAGYAGRVGASLSLAVMPKLMEYTISFAEVVRLVALNWDELTQGPWRSTIFRR